MFRGNEVAIKKMKETLQTEESMEEFNKEVSMLDKFRNEYIVHFYGAVFIPNKICMVTEYAKYGSLNDLIMKYKDNPISEKIRIKILIDCSKGISYLHNNGILHRDIKPDNFLIFDIDNIDKSIINAKLTDCGSRNINILMTNITFIKGIGTPTYMSPEILNKQHYNKSLDIIHFQLQYMKLWNGMNIILINRKLISPNGQIIDYGWFIFIKLYFEQKWNYAIQKYVTNITII